MLTFAGCGGGTGMRIQDWEYIERRGWRREGIVIKAQCQRDALDAVVMRRHTAGIRTKVLKKNLNARLRSDVFYFSPYSV